MIKDPDMLRKIEEDFLKKEGEIDYLHSLKIVESLYNEALHLGAFPLKDPMEGIEVDIRIARILNSCLKNCLQE